MHIKSEDEFDFEPYRALMTEGFNRCILFDRKSLERKAEYFNALLVSNEELLMTYMNGYKGCTKYFYNSKSDYLRFLQLVVGVPSSYFKGESMDKKKVLLPIYIDNFGREFLDIYFSYTSNKTLLSKVNSTLYDNSIKVSEDLVAVHYDVKEVDNQRLVSDSISYHNVARALLSDITPPPNCMLIWGDLPQADLRVLYNTILRIKDSAEDKLWCTFKDKYRYFYESIYGLNSDNEAAFKEFRPKAKVTILSASYGASAYSMSMKGPDLGFCSTLRKYFDKHPKYSKMVTKINKTIQFGTSIYVENIFGYKEQVSVNARQDKILDYCLNKPMQSTTAGIIARIIMTIYNDVKNTFNLSTSDFGLYMSRYDDFVFYLNKSRLDVLVYMNKFRPLQINDWEPFELELEAGYRFKVPDEDLMSKLTTPLTVTPQAYNGEDFYPFKDLAHYAVLKEGDNIYKVFDLENELFYTHKGKFADLIKEGVKHNIYYFTIDNLENNGMSMVNGAYIKFFKKSPAFLNSLLSSRNFSKTLSLYNFFVLNRC